MADLVGAAGRTDALARRDRAGPLGDGDGGVRSRAARRRRGACAGLAPDPARRPPGVAGRPARGAPRRSLSPARSTRWRSPPACCAPPDCLRAPSCRSPRRRVAGRGPPRGGRATGLGRRFPPRPRAATSISRACGRSATCDRYRGPGSPGAPVRESDNSGSPPPGQGKLQGKSDHPRRARARSGWSSDRSKRVRGSISSSPAPRHCRAAARGSWWRQEPSAATACRCACRDASSPPAT